MALNIRNQQTEKLTNELVALTGETKTAAITKAIADRISFVKKQKSKTNNLASELHEISIHCANLPLLDDRAENEMLYDESGMPL